MTWNINRSIHSACHHHLLCWISWVAIEKFGRLMVMVTLATTSAYRTRSSCPGCPGLGTVTASSRNGFLPALTLAACRSKIIVTAAVSVESHSHLFVFHLVVHLCISMVSARGCTEKRATLKKKEKKEKARSLPQSNKKKKKMYLYYSAMCVSIRMPFTARLGPSDPLHLKPSSQTDGKGALMKKKKKTRKKKKDSKRKALCFPGSCAPSGGWTNAGTLNLNRL